jgi:hypothetical protein
MQAVELLREVAAVDPAVYERQQKEDAAGTGGVRNVAAFVAELAARCARRSGARRRSTSALIRGSVFACGSAGEGPCPGAAHGLDGRQPVIDTSPRAVTYVAMHGASVTRERTLSGCRARW